MLFLLGLLFALAFCPYSGMLYFGGLIPPMTIVSTSGLIYPPVFALATGLPVIIIAWLLAYSVSNIGTFYKKMNSFQEWFKRGGLRQFLWLWVAYYIIISL